MTTRRRSSEAVDESNESEITIFPDGRIYAFGITRPVAALLATLPTSDERTKRLLERIIGVERHWSAGPRNEENV